MTRDQFVRQEARVPVATTAEFLALNGEAARSHSASWPQDDLEAVIAPKEGHVVVPMWRNADGALRCYTWVGLASGGRVLQTVDVQSERFDSLHLASEQLLRHLVDMLLTEVQPRRLDGEPLGPW
jgi:hypothetical protein